MIFDENRPTCSVLVHPITSWSGRLTGQQEEAASEVRAKSR